MKSRPGRSLREVFLAAAEIDDPRARAAYLDRACGQDEACRLRVEALLAADAEGGRPPESPPRKRSPGGPSPGDRIGRYKLLQELGAGGCGVVFMAEQDEPIRRKVALKVIKLGMDTRQVIARFEAERQALALMDHPHIARVFDAGATDSGRPYFVMELVRGIKITDYCDEHRLSAQARLDLFMQVCHAVQHAHQKGIIHRDLKPSNILVTELDGKPLPKVIDFGIAKATGGRLTDQTLFTAFEQFIGTPAYMSPEQAALNAADVDTRSDVYSLGVLLYELLTGEPPFDTRTLLASGLDEMRRTIREVDPVRPSTRLRQAHQSSPSPSARPPRPSFLASDLDWIVMKCLEKERGRRYETANGLAMDIQRHLSNEPVVARPPSRLYEFQKTVRRHWVGFAAIAAVTFVLASGIAATSCQALRASHAEQQARRELERAVTAEQQVERERNRAQLLAAEAALERGQAGLEKGDRIGLLDLVESYRLAEHAPSFRETVGRRWSTWHAEWARRTIAVRPSWGIPTPDHLRFATLKDWPPLNTSPAIEVVDMLTGARVAGPWKHDSIGKGGAFSRDGRVLATITDNGAIHLWDCGTGAPVRPPCETGLAELNRLSFSPCGRFLAAFSLPSTGLPQSPTVALVRLDDPQAPARLLDHRYSVRGAMFSPDGEVLAILAAPDVQLWSTENLQPMGSPIAVSFSGLLEFNHDGSRLAISPPNSRGVRFLEPGTQRILQEIPVTGRQGAAAAGFSHDGNLLATCNWDGTLQLWRTNAPGEPHATHRLRDRMFGRFAFHPDDTLLAVGDAAGEVRVMHTQDGRIAHTLRMQPYASAHFLSNGVLAARALGQAAFWDLAATPLRASVLPDDAPASSMAFDPSGDLLAVGGRRALRLWRVEDPLRLEHLISMPGRVLALVYAAAEDQFVAFTEDGSLTGVDPRTGSSQLIRHIDRGYELTARMSPDARRLALTRYNEALVVDMQTGAITHLPPAGGFLSATFRADSQRLAVGLASWAVFDYDTSGAAAVLRGEWKDQGGWVYGVAYHPDGQLLAVNVEHKLIRLIEADSGRQLFRGYVPSLAEVELLRFSPDGSLLATAGRTHEGRYGIELWQVDLQRGLFRACSVLPSAQPIEGLAFSPDHRTLAVGGQGPTRLWHLPPMPTSLGQMESQTWATIGFKLDDSRNLVPVQRPIEDIEEARARLTQEPTPSATPWEVALRLPADEALAALEELARQQPGAAAYQDMRGRLHMNLMVTNAVQGQWKEALAHANQAIRSGYDDPYTQAHAAFLALAVDDRSAYRARCREMVEQYQTSGDPAVIQYSVAAAALQPGALEDYAAIVKRAQDAAPLVKGRYAPAYQYFVGAALARAGRYAEAAVELEHAAQGFGSIAPGYSELNSVHCSLLLAIVHAHLGQQESARKWFDDAMADMPRLQQAHSESSGAGWALALAVRLLQEEARAALDALTP